MMREAFKALIADYNSLLLEPDQLLTQIFLNKLKSVLSK